MTRIRTTPLPTETITQDRIVNVHINIAYNADGTIDNDLTTIGYNVVHLDASGNAISNDSKAISRTIWGPTLNTSLNNLYGLIKTDAENEGFLAPGTDENEINV